MSYLNWLATYNPRCYAWCNYGEVICMSEHRNYVATLDGQLLDLGSLAISYSYTGSVLNYAQTAITLESGATATYRQTYTYTSGNITGVSGWVRQ